VNGWEVEEYIGNLGIPSILFTKKVRGINCHDFGVERD